MFSIAHTLRSNQVQARTVDSTEKPTTHDEVKVNFGNGSSAMFSRVQLEKLVAFNILMHPNFNKLEKNEIDLPKGSSTTLRMIMGLIIEKKFICDLLTPEVLANPKFCEELCEDLDCYHPEEGKHLQQKLKSNLESMNLEQAKAVLAAFNKNKSSKSDLPRAVGIAERITHSALFFPSEEAASVHYETLRLLSTEINDCEIAEKNALATMSNNKDPIVHELASSQYKAFNRGVTFIYGELNKWVAKSPQPSSLSMINRQDVQRNANHENPEVRALVAKCAQELEDYKILIKKALSSGYSDLTRTDLLEYLIGPKAYLFDHYGLQYNEHKSPSHSFQVSFQGCLGYSLTNDGPMELEEEIREDVRKYTRVPGDLVVQERVCTKPISEEIKKLRNELCPILLKWTSPEIDDNTINDVKNTLIRRSGWDQFGITCENIRMNQPSTITGTTQITGELVKFERRIKFYFQANDFQLLIRTSMGDTCPNPIKTKNFLRELVQSQSCGPMVPPEDNIHVVSMR